MPIGVGEGVVGAVVDGFREGCTHRALVVVLGGIGSGAVMVSRWWPEGVDASLRRHDLEGGAGCGG